MYTRIAALVALVAIFATVSAAVAAKGPPPPPKAVNGHKSTKQVIGRGSYFGQVQLTPHNASKQLADAENDLKKTTSSFDRFAKLHVIASMQPYHAIDDGRWAESKIGHERAKSTYAFRSLIDAGATLTFGSDWTVAPLNPILGIYAAVTRRTIDGKNPNGWIPEQKITVEEALRSYTVNNAFAMFRENEIGRIAPGMRADLAVLSDDLFTIAPENIENVRVEMTIFDGEVLLSRH